MSSHTLDGKKFAGQYSGEKILFWIYESPVSFIIHIAFLAFAFIILFCIISVFLSYVIHFIVGILFFIGASSGMIYHFSHEYHGNSLVFTTRRIIKNIHSGIFSTHKKELHIKDFKQVISTQNTFFEKIFGYGNIVVNFGDASGISFRGIKNASELSDYIARIMDYMEKNEPTDNIARFKTRKERYHSHS